MRTAFQWESIDHWTMPDLIESLQLVSTEDEAESFMAAYEAVCGDETAVHNLRYMLALIERSEAERVAELFMVAVPSMTETLEPRHTFGTSSLGVKSA